MGEGSVEVAAQYTEHGTADTLGYGVDWMHGDVQSAVETAATCSFYDRLLHTWTVSL